MNGEPRRPDGNPDVLGMSGANRTSQTGKARYREEDKDSTNKTASADVGAFWFFSVNGSPAPTPLSCVVREEVSRSADVREDDAPDTTKPQTPTRAGHLVRAAGQQRQPTLDASQEQPPDGALATAEPGGERGVRGSFRKLFGGDLDGGWEGAGGAGGATRAVEGHRWRSESRAVCRCWLCLSFV